MQVSITFRHMEASDAVRNHIDSKLEHIAKYLIKPIEVHVTLSVEKFRHTAEIVLLEQHFQAKAKETTDDMYLSIDKVLDKVEKQVKKRKEKVQEHHKHHFSVGEVAIEEEKEFFRQRASGDIG